MDDEPLHPYHQDSSPPRQEITTLPRRRESPSWRSCQFPEALFQYPDPHCADSRRRHVQRCVGSAGEEPERLDQARVRRRRPLRTVPGHRPHQIAEPKVDLPQPRGGLAGEAAEFQQVQAAYRPLTAAAWALLIDVDEQVVDPLLRALLIAEIPAHAAPRPGPLGRRLRARSPDIWRLWVEVWTRAHAEDVVRRELSWRAGRRPGP